jgi:hypothetical protein
LTGENKVIIEKRLQLETPHPLLEFDVWHQDDNVLRRQVAFCARWALENMFEPLESSSVARTVPSEAHSSNELIETHLNNALLLAPDAGSYAKLSPSGLSARCDAGSFESVCCSFKMTVGVWYYECELLTGGVMQIGLAGSKSRFLSDEGCGVGDDRFSVAYDGCRQLLWYDARPTSVQQNGRIWRPSDVIGCLIDCNSKMVIFYLNDKLVACSKEVFTCAPDGLYAAASLMSFQQCRFNFGSEPFRYPPIGKQFETFEQNGKLTEEQKQQFMRQRRRRLKLKELQMPSFKEDACPLCCDSAGNVLLLPCEHGGFCDTCAAQLQFCPLCRGSIDGWKQQRVAGESDCDRQTPETSEMSGLEPETQPQVGTSDAKSLRSNVKETKTSVSKQQRHDNCSPSR